MPNRSDNPGAIHLRLKALLFGLRHVPKLRDHADVLLRYLDATEPGRPGKTAARSPDVPDAETSAEVGEGGDSTVIVPQVGPFIPTVDQIAAAWEAVYNYFVEGAAFMSQPAVQEFMEPVEMRTPRSVAGRRMPTKIDRVFYHDPSEREVGPAEVCKVHKLQPGEEMPQLNLSYLTESATRGSKLHASWGPGKKGHWWFMDHVE